MTVEQNAIRHPKRGKAHRAVEVDHCVRWHRYVSGVATVCNRIVSVENRNLTERLPLSQTAPEDRCKTCWKDVTP